jgi:UV DNA damage endonuclease
MNEIRHGVCCIVLSLDNNPRKFQTMTYKKFSETPRQEALDILSKRIINNVEATLEAIKYCKSENYCYRISSNLLPLVTYDKAEIALEALPEYENILSCFDKIKEYVKENKVRCSMHPDQFVVPASAKLEVVAKSVLELKHHAMMMDLIGLPQSYDSPINIHMNCFKGDLSEISDRFVRVYDDLPYNVKSRLVLEIEDKKNSWGLEDLFCLNKKTGIPITYDSLHFRLNNPKNISPKEAVEKCIGTWGSCKPLFHFSNGKSGPLDRSHSDYVYETHEELFQYNIDIDFEFKAKNFAIKKFFERKDSIK